MEYKLPLDMLYHWEQTCPDKIFLHQPVNDVYKTWTWKQAAEEVRRMAAALKATNMPPNSQIAVISKNCAHWILSDLAIMMAGHVSVPLYPNLLAANIHKILTHCEASILFVGKLDDWPSMKAGVPEGVRCISFPYWRHEEYENWEDIIQSYPPLPAKVERRPEEIATIVYTSGTTGNPKGVMHTFQNFGFVLFHAIAYLKITHRERYFSYLPLSHVAERVLVEMGSIYTGGEVYFTESLEKFSKNIQDAKPTVFLGVHRIWMNFQQGVLKNISQKKLDLLLKVPIVSGLVKRKIKKGLGLSEAINIFTGAAPTPVSLIKWYSKLGIRIQESYAMTENCCFSHVTLNNHIKIGWVGQPFPQCEFKLGIENEILIKHDALMTGYYKDPVGTSESFDEERYLKTGDVGKVDAEGFLQITGRVKDIFKTAKGKYVAPSPIEMKISKLVDIAFVCVVGQALPQPMAIIILNASGMEKSRVDIGNELVQLLLDVNLTLDKHEQLARFILLKEDWTVENDMLTPTFKIKRNRVEKRYADKFEAWATETENVIWQF
jgi:long-chain acyl-CoA synthetase